MKAKLKRKWLFTLCPAVVGCIAAWWLDKTNPELPVIVTRFDIASVLLLVGVLLSILLFIYHWRSENVQKQYEILIENEGVEHRQFLRRLDHELKNPLSAITTRVATINNSVGSAPLEVNVEPQDQIKEIQQMVFQIDEQTCRIKRLVSDLRKLSELETCTLEFSVVEIDRILQQFFEDLKKNPASKHKKILLTVPKTPWTLPKIWTDEDLLYLVLQNLTDNAVKYTQKDDTIEIRAHEIHDQVMIEVADSGIGIPENEFENIGNELYRARNSRGIPGYGLGLSIVKTIMRRLEGEFAIRSKEGAGTVVSIQLPKWNGEA